MIITAQVTADYSLFLTASPPLHFSDYFLILQQRASSKPYPTVQQPFISNRHRVVALLPSIAAPSTEWWPYCPALQHQAQSGGLIAQHCSTKHSTTCAPLQVSVYSLQHQAQRNSFVGPKLDWVDDGGEGGAWAACARTNF